MDKGAQFEEPCLVARIANYFVRDLLHKLGDALKHKANVERYLLLVIHEPNVGKRSLASSEEHSRVQVARLFSVVGIEGRDAVAFNLVRQLRESIDNICPALAKGVSGLFIILQPRFALERCLRSQSGGKNCLYLQYSNRRAHLRLRFIHRDIPKYDRLSHIWKNEQMLLF